MKKLKFYVMLCTLIELNLISLLCVSIFHVWLSYGGCLIGLDLSSNILRLISNRLTNSCLVHINNLLSSWLSESHLNSIQIGLLNLMLSELREDLFKSTSSNREVSDQVLLKSHGAKISEDLMKSNLIF